MSDIQQAYLMGELDVFDLGGHPALSYLEYEFDSLDPTRLERALNRLVRRHDGLRAIFDVDGQRIQERVPRQPLEVVDLRSEPEGVVGGRLAELQDRLS
jgi:hypothetical protein